MSLEKKIKSAAFAAASDAMATERARCLWCADEVVRDLETKMKGKLMSPVELEAANMKLKIAKGVVTAIRLAITSGARPQGGQGLQPGPAVSPATEKSGG